MHKIRDRNEFWGDILENRPKTFRPSAKKILILGDSKGEDLYVSLKQDNRFTEDNLISYI